MYKTLCVAIMFMAMGLLFADNAFAGTEENPIWQYKLNEYASQENVKSLIFVKCTGGSNAKVSLYKKENNSFINTFNYDAFIGKNGLGKEKEGDSKSPEGDFGIIQAFGIKANPGTSINYLNVTKDHYCCDEDCQYYNKIIDAKAVNHKCKGEHIIDYVPQYNYGFFLDYNKEGVYPKGSAILFHVKGKRPYTAGCIAVDEEAMITILNEIDSNTRICIYKAN